MKAALLLVAISNKIFFFFLNIFHIFAPQCIHFAQSVPLKGLSHKKYIFFVSMNICIYTKIAHITRYSRNIVIIAPPVVKKREEQE